MSLGVCILDAVLSLSLCAFCIRFESRSGPWCCVSDFHDNVRFHQRRFHSSWASHSCPLSRLPFRFSHFLSVSSWLCYLFEVLVRLFRCAARISWRLRLYLWLQCTLLEIVLLQLQTFIHLTSRSIWMESGSCGKPLFCSRSLMSAKSAISFLIVVGAETSGGQVRVTLLHRGGKAAKSMGPKHAL